MLKATLVTGVVAVAFWFGLMGPFETLNGIAFWLVEIPLLIAHFSTGLPLGRGENGFLVPNAFGFAFLAGVFWLVAFVLALAIGKPSREDREQEGCYACGSTGFIQVGSLKRVCGVCDGSGRQSPPNKSLERTREELSAKPNRPRTRR